ncbi:hypothetical protein CHS0354_023175 [Potamilus streckersoni]|uniref:ZP domain-containing protein n=1 Tax=Potamilus streckersoni TaxID=2493646 RepID=A0AAE0TAY0_9BIVA|nr:hypothetical protein CHS0354_023175 [Potamilus streckersoni]
MDTVLLSNFTDMNTPTIPPIASSAPIVPRHSMEARLYAFHFVGSYSIEIVCNITVCQSDDNSCPSNVVPTHVILAPTTGSSNTGLTPVTSSTTKSSPPNSARRKRNVVPVGPRTETVRTYIRVVDTFADIMHAYGTSKGNRITHNY